MDDLITAEIKGVEIKFKTRPGVFSKEGVDDGSRLLLNSIDLTVVPDKGLVADLGCGSGVVGLSLAKLLPRAHVHLLDVNLRAVELARQNADLNSCTSVEIYLSDQFSATADRSYHLIVSNPAQHLGNEFLEEAAKECLDHLKLNGVVYWVAQNRLQPYIKRLFAEIFGAVIIVAHGKKHLVLKAVKRLETK